MRGIEEAITLWNQLQKDFGWKNLYISSGEYNACVEELRDRRILLVDDRGERKLGFNHPLWSPYLIEQRGSMTTTITVDALLEVTRENGKHCSLA